LFELPSVQSHQILEGLKENITYVFIFCHPEAKLVCDVEKPALHYVAAFDNGTGLEVGKDHSVKDYPLSQKEITTLENIDDIVTTVNSIDPCDYSGLFCYHEKKMKCYRMSSRDYYLVKLLRGNKPNLVWRYLHLRKRSYNLCQLLRTNYAEMASKFDELETGMLDLEKRIIRDKYHVFKNQNGSKGPKVIFGRNTFFLLKAVELRENNWEKNGSYQFDLEKAIRSQLIYTAPFILEQLLEENKQNRIRKAYKGN